MSDETIHRGRKAKEILDNDLFREAHSRMREAYISGLLRCQPNDDVGRFRYAEGLRYLDAHRQNLENILKAGELAEVEDLSTKRPTPIERLKRVF